ncbi:hypothetical protein [Microbacterium sp.]|uniref:hypothetical protein n=1 Tax=Microbacterium sp. TaxID=51671 RepID=UPI003C71F741
MPAIAIAGLLLLTGCAGGDPPTPSSADSTAPGTASAADPAAVPGADATEAQHLAPTASGWLAGNEVTLTSAEYDPDAGRIVVTADVKNTSEVESFTGEYLSWVFLDVGAGAPATALQFSSTAVAQATTEVEMSFFAPDDGLVLADAVLQLGASGQRQWLLPLDPDAEATGSEPKTAALSGTIDASGMTLTLASVSVVPWTCSDSDDYGTGGTGRVTYEPVADDKLGVVVRGDFAESVAYTGGNAVSTMTLEQPDGISVNAIGAVWHVFAAGDRAEDYALCFTVDAPATGTYTLGFTTYRGASASGPITLP